MSNVFENLLWEVTNQLNRLPNITQQIEAHQLLTPRSGSQLIDYITSLSENKKWLIWLLILLAPLIVWIELFAFPNHSGFSLYVILSVLFSLLTYQVLFIVIFATLLASMRFGTFLHYSDFTSPSFFFIVWAMYCFVGILVSKTMKIMVDARDSQLKSIYSFLHIIQMKDHYTAVHSRNVAALTLAIATEMQLSKDSQKNLYTGALLHDIGKIGIPDSILVKPTSLTSLEFAEIKKHPEFGVELLQNVSLIQNKEIHDSILYHHERFDGTGYPAGLAGTEIPLAGRILALADTYDAITTNRIYRKQRTSAEAQLIILQSSGKQFDPDVVDAFVRVMENSSSLIEEQLMSQPV